MKTRAPLCLLVAAAASLAWFSASISATEKAPVEGGHNVIMDEASIVIPGTEISTADQKAMNKILNKYDKSLYRIDTYENGKLKKTQGQLTDVVTDKQLASEIAANVKRTGFTQSAVLIRMGATTNPQHVSNPAATTNPQRVSNPAATTNPQRVSSPGSTTNPQHSQNASPSPGASTNPQKSSSAAMQKSDDLVERLKPILKKYQRK